MEDRGSQIEGFQKPSSILYLPSSPHVQCSGELFMMEMRAGRPGSLQEKLFRMNSWVVLSVGVSLVVLGLLFMRWHILEWRREKTDSSLDPGDLLHYHARYRRRMQTSGMLVVVGFLIPLMDWLLEERQVIPATLVGFLIFALIGWIFLMAFGDMLSTRTHSHVALAKVRQKQRELERQLAELKSRETNGHSNTKGNSYN
jgi:hypothetical protein